jgi:hypothetical protein
MSWRERLHELLRLYGNGNITTEQFWAQMREQNLSDKDIDRYCRGEQ